MKSIEPPNLAMERRAPAEPDVQAKLRAMLVIRLLFSVSVFLLGPIFFRSHAPTLYLFTGALFFLTLLYAFLLQWGFDPKLFANLQIFADVFLVTLLITLTGWENSNFGFLYIIPITTASLFFQLRESVSVAVLSSILYAAVVFFHRYRLSPGTGTGGFELIYTLYVRTIIFCLVGFLCGHLANLLKKQKEELTEVKGLRDLILASMNSGLITTDVGNSIIHANSAAQQILGFSPRKMYNHPLGEFFTDRQNGSPDQILHKAMAGPEDPEGIKPELEAKTASGRKIPIGFNLSAITNGSGEQVGKVMVFSDLTKVKELEKRLRAVEKFRTAGELAAGIAHEIRNPLTSITGSIEMLSESQELSEPNRQLLSVTLKESARLNRIIEDFLAYAKRGSLDTKKENLSEIVKDCIEGLCRAGTLPRGVHMNLVTPSHPVMVAADKPLIGQVFLNLLGNAVDAVDGAGTISATVEGPFADAHDAPTEPNQPSAPRQSRPLLGKGRYCSVTITDSGAGMPQEELCKVFEPFFTTKKNGVGIGLCVAERIVREHNGYIDIISEEGKGTSVTVVIPTRQTAEGPDGPSPRASDGEGFPREDRTSEDTERLASPWGAAQPALNSG